MSSSGPCSRPSGNELSELERPLIGVIGGSGLCELPNLAVSERVLVETQYGLPSGPVSLGNLGGVRVAFMPRHGADHSFPPHKVPYKANLAALKAVGVTHVVATCVVGSLREGLDPGLFVVPDQFINMTWGRDDTYEADGGFEHLAMASPYCEHTRRVLAGEIEASRLPLQPFGTVVVIQGPRFSTIAESKMFAMLGGDVVNMTQYPECYFARELGMCYAAVATVTDYDVGVSSAISMLPESMGRVLEVFKKNTVATLALLERVARCSEKIAACSCAASQLEVYYKAAKTP